MTAAAIHFSSPARIPYPGGCVTEPAFFALDYLVKWRANVMIGEQPHPDAEVLTLLKAVIADPESYGVTTADAQAAKAQFLEQAGQALEQEGGQRAWLEREFA
ncbi:hypothetical protein [Deinococcus sp.]|uniref:hypothetical protein n=1 Tax=Deinococcus sp. TaxID=47478 RepID=UPI003CC58693